MCGIQGFIGKNDQKLREMNALQSHRGPDFSGTFTDDTISLGHTLLSIREATELSKQPFTKEGSPWVLLFNGQLYNTKAIKRELGVAYQTIDLDTALLFGLIEKYGFDFIPKINGMFAIALYHKDLKELRLYRDSSGQKNIYVYSRGNSFAFASEIKTLLAYGIDKEIDPEGLSLATSLGYIPSPHTLFLFIKKLSPGTYLSLDIAHNEIKTFDFTSDTSNYYEGLTPAEVFTHLIDEHFQSKQKVAINLSGGLDSSILLHEAKKAGHELFTYTNYFETTEEKYNRDALLAKRLAKDYGAHHTEIIITKDNFLKAFTESYETIEEPNYNISLPAYLLTAKKEGIHGDKNRVILSGDGGDEVFGGYDNYLKSSRIDQYRNIFTPLGFDLLKNFRNKTNRFFRFGDMDERWFFFKQLNFTATKETIDIIPLLHKEIDRYKRNYTKKTGSQYEIMIRDRIFWLASENFIRSDKLYMKESLEMRSPFGYEPFRAYFDSLLSEKDYVSNIQNKNFLRNEYLGKLPDYITKREDKSGWRAPITLWYNEEYKSLFLEILYEAKSKGGAFIDWEKVITLVANKETWPGKYAHVYLSLALLSNLFSINL